MSIQDQLQTDLAKLTSGGPHVVTAQENGRTLTCDIIEATPLAHRVDRFMLETDELAGASIDRLQKISEDLSSRVTYLLEPIGPIERDHEQCIVQMRSNPPQQDDDGTRYYELLVQRGGRIELRRYQKQSGQPRELVTALLTSEVLVRLAGDFAAAVDSVK